MRRRPSLAHTLAAMHGKAERERREGAAGRTMFRRRKQQQLTDVLAKKLMFGQFSRKYLRRRRVAPPPRLPSLANAVPRATMG